LPTKETIAQEYLIPEFKIETADDDVFLEEDEEMVKR